MKKTIYSFLLLLLLACNRQYAVTSVQYEQKPVGKTAPVDSVLYQAIIPYRDSVDRAMNTVLGQLGQPLEKRQPDGSLNRFMADAALYGARKTFAVPVHAAFVNYGGVRLNEVAAGAVTRGKIFELMPFDNALVLQTVSGDTLQQFLNIIAARGGWPVSGVRFAIKDGKAVDVLIDGKPLQPQMQYSIAHSDYIANGGDDITLFAKLPQQNKGYLLRDALLHYVAFFTSSGKPITIDTQNRITK